MQQEQTPRPEMHEWVAFWNSTNSIYVNARRRDVHYQYIANDIRDYLPGFQACVLDYGCGEALHADRIAQVAAHLTLCDAAPEMHDNLAASVARPILRVRAPAEIEAS